MMWHPMKLKMTFYRGSELLTNFVKQRLLPDSTGNLHGPNPQNKSKTCANLTTYMLLHHQGKVKLMAP